MPASDRTWWNWASAVTTVLVALGCGLVLWAFTPPSPNGLFLGLAVVPLVVFAVLWSAFALIGWSKYRARGWSVVAPVLVLLTVGAVALSLPRTVAFAVSEDALTETVSQCRSASGGQRIGVYTVVAVRPLGTGCLVFVDSGLGDSIGFGYLPDGPPAPGRPQYDEAIDFFDWSGDWYRFEQDF